MATDTKQKSVKQEMKLQNHAHNISLRTWLTKGFILMYFLFFAATVGIWGYSALVPLDGRTSEIKDMVLTISGLFSGPIGLIIGYFFWGDRDRG